MISLGDTFLLPGTRPDEGRHLFVVISDPVRSPDDVVLVPLTTFEHYKDQSCILNVGDHPFVKHPTCIGYSDAQCSPVKKLGQLLESRDIRRRKPMCEDVLARILEGAAKTRMLPSKCDMILHGQGLID